MEYNKKYDKSFTARLIQSEDEIKDWYTELKNYLLSYKKVNDRMSWKRETYKQGRNMVAKMSYRGKTLCLFLPLNPDDYLDSKYKVEDASENATFVDTPCMYRIKNERRAKYAMELIDEVMTRLGGVKRERESVDYYLPYEGTAELIEKGLIKVIIQAAQGGAPIDDEEEIEPPVEVVEPPVQVVEPEPVVETVEVYNRSFRSKFIMASDETKQWYSELKNELLSYDGVNEVMNWKNEDFSHGDNHVAKFGFKGKTFCLFLPINVADYDSVVYTLTDVSDNPHYVETPTMYRINSEKRVKKAIELISDVMAKHKILKQPRENVDYFEPYQSQEQLIESGLIKIENIAKEN